jgi:integrase
MDRAVGVTADRLRAFVASRQEEGAAAGTIKRQLGILRRAFRLAVESWVLSTVPHFPSVADSPARQGFFSKSDFEDLLSHINNTDLEDYLQWFYLTGMRPGETKSLTWANFDREEWTIRLPAHIAKSGKGRLMAVEGDLRAVVERRVAARRLDCTLIFHRKGKPIGDFMKRWKTACKAAGVEGRLPYDLRRTAIRDMVRAGVSQNVAMQISGHKTSAVFRRYDIVDAEDLRDAMKKRDAYLSNIPAEGKVENIAEARASKNLP